MYARPTTGTKILLKNSTVNFTDGVLLSGWGNISNNSTIAMDLTFSGCTVNKQLDDSYKGTENGVKVTYN